MYRITKSFTFSASHRLEGLPAEHQCARLHGHNYIVELILESQVLDEVGFVTDFGALAPVKRWLDNMFDHRHLNNVLPMNPTSENFAAYIYGRWAEQYPLAAVRVSETGTSWAEYRN